MTVARRRSLTPSIAEFTLVPADGMTLPEYGPGAHVTVKTPSGAMRRYSLVGPGAHPENYVIAVKKEPDSRGGSQSMHDEALEGTELLMEPPENEFPLKDAPKYLLIAGGLFLPQPYGTVIAGAVGRDAAFGIQASIGGLLKEPDQDIGGGPGLPVLGDDVVLEAGAIVLVATHLPKLIGREMPAQEVVTATMPNRARSGELIRPVRVVAPMRVKGCRGMLIVLACMPLSTVKSTLKSSMAG